MTVLTNQSDAAKSLQHPAANVSPRAQTEPTTCSASSHTQQRPDVTPQSQHEQYRSQAVELSSEPAVPSPSQLKHVTKHVTERLVTDWKKLNSTSSELLRPARTQPCSTETGRWIICRPEPRSILLASSLVLPDTSKSKRASQGFPARRTRSDGL